MNYFVNLFLRGDLYYRLQILKPFLITCTKYKKRHTKYRNKAIMTLRAHLLASSTFNCCSISQHFLIYKTILQIFSDLQFFRGFKFFFGNNFLKFWAPINLSWGHVRSYKKIGRDQHSRFDVYWIQKNRHPDKQSIIDLAKYLNIWNCLLKSLKNETFIWFLSIFIFGISIKREG